MNNLNNDLKLVSVIIPAYNVDQYISKTIESVIQQTYKNLEIIIINDGSNDNTLEILNKYSCKDNRIIIINQFNKGLSAARNSGMKISHGDYICLIDADDIMLPDKIEKQVFFLDKNSSFDFTFSRVYYFQDKINNIYKRDFYLPKNINIYKRLIRNGNFISPNSVLFKKDIFDKFGGFDEDLKSSEDFDYWLFLSRNNVKFINQDEYLTLCRMRDGSLTKDSLNMYLTLLKVIKKNIFIDKKNNFLSKIRSYQYLRTIFILFIISNKKNIIKINKDIIIKKDNFFNSIFNFFKKIKFLLTFRKNNNLYLKEYLLKIENSSNI